MMPSVNRLKTCENGLGLRIVVICLKNRTFVGIATTQNEHSTQSNQQSTSRQEANQGTSPVGTGVSETNISISQSGGAGVGDKVSDYKQRVESLKTDSRRSSRHSLDVVNQSIALQKVAKDLGKSVPDQLMFESTAEAFHAAISESKKHNPNSWMVDVKDVADYEKCKTFLTEDGQSGVAVTPDGDIVSVFSFSKEKGRMKLLIPMAVAFGGVVICLKTRTFVGAIEEVNQSAGIDKKVADLYNNELTPLLNKGEKEALKVIKV